MVAATSCGEVNNVAGVYQMDSQKGKNVRFGLLRIGMKQIFTPGVPEGELV